MRAKAVIFTACFSLVLALLLLVIPQNASASTQSLVSRETPDVAGSDETMNYIYYVDFLSEADTFQSGSIILLQGQVFSPGQVNLSGFHVMVIMEDSDGVDYFNLVNTSSDGIFWAEFQPRSGVLGRYSVLASADAVEESKRDDMMEIMVVAPPPEEEETPFIYFQVGAILAAFASMAVASTESAGFSLFNIFAFPLYSRLKKEEVLDHFVRGQIYGFIVSNPGKHYNSIREKLNVTNGTLSYHLRTLELQGFIKSRKEGIYRRFYPIEMKYPRDRGVKLSDLQIAVLDLTRRKPAPTQKDIAFELDISQQVASYNLRILAHKGFVQVRKEDRKRLYYPVDERSPTGL